MKKYSSSLGLTEDKLKDFSTKDEMRKPYRDAAKLEYNFA